MSVVLHTTDLFFNELVGQSQVAIWKSYQPNSGGVRKGGEGGRGDECPQQKRRVPCIADPCYPPKLCSAQSKGIPTPQNIHPGHEVWLALFFFFSFFHKYFCCQRVPLKDLANLNPPASPLVVFLPGLQQVRHPQTLRAPGCRIHRKSIMFRLFLNFQATFPPHEQQACHLEQCLTHTTPALKL